MDRPTAVPGGKAHAPVPGRDAAGKPAAPDVTGTPAVAPAPTPVPATDATPAVAAPPPVPVPPAQQLAVHIVPLRREADGVHRLTVHLHPDDLGPVSVVAEVRNGDVTVALSGATQAGRDALQAALPDLRQELSQAGFGNCTLDLRQDAPGGGPEYRQPTPVRQADAGTGPAQPVPPPTAAPPTADRNRLLDLRI